VIGLVQGRPALDMFTVGVSLAVGNNNHKSIPKFEFYQTIMHK
jgi:hypothetical protein